MLGEEKEGPFLFVYGTLRKGFPHPMASYLATQAQFIGNYWTKGRLFDLGPYPAAIFSPAYSEYVFGDVFKIFQPEVLIPELDEYEDYDPANVHNSLYERILIKMDDPDFQTTVWAYSYLGTPSLSELIAGGDYLSYLKRKP